MKNKYVLCDMFTLSEEQRNIIGWVITIGMSFGVGALSALTLYCFYSCYKVIKNFAKKYWRLVNFLIYINVMKVHYTNIKRWNTFTNREDRGMTADIV